MKKDNKKEMVEYTPTVLMKNFVIYQLLILYITLNVGDVFSSLSELGNALTRYIPVALVTLVSVFIILKKNVSKCLGKDKEEVKQKVILAPIIVAVILFGYGLYSVESNLSSIRSDMNYSYYSLYMSTSEIQSQLSEAASEARVNWLITSIVYLIAAECVVFVRKERFDEWLKEEYVYEEENLVNNNITSVDSNEEKESLKEEVPLSNINWNL